jgi:hypothetical protein
MISNIKNGYFIDSTTGLAYNLHLLNMGDYKNNLKDINDEVDRRNGLYKGEAGNFLVTLGFHLATWDEAMKTSPAMANVIAAKTRPFVYLGLQTANPEEIILPSGFAEKSFVWNASNDRVYTPYDSNALSRRYKPMNANLIPDPIVTPPATPPATPDAETPVVTSGADLKLGCLKVATSIAIHNGKNKILTIDPIEELADKLLVYVKKTA